MKESLLQILPSLENILFECNFVSSSPQLNFSQIHSSCEHSIFPGKLSFNTHMFFQVTLGAAPQTIKMLLCESSLLLRPPGNCRGGV